MLLLVKVNILLVITIGIFNLFQLFLKNAEIDKIKKRMLEINDKIENYNKTNEMLDKMEQRLEGIETKLK